MTIVPMYFNHSGMDKTEYKEVITELMGELVENQLTQADRDAIAKDDARIARKNKKSYMIGTAGLAGIAYGTYKILSDMDQSIDTFQQIFHTNYSNAYMWVGVGTTFAAILGAVVCGVYFFSKYNNTAFKRSIYLKYQDARDMLTKSGLEKNQENQGL